MGRRKATPEMEDRMRELRGMGWELVDIAREVGVSYASVSHYTKPGGVKEDNRRKREIRRKLHQDVVAFFGGKCSNPGCNVTDWRILDVNHLNGGGREDIKKYGGYYVFCRAILDGRRPTDDLNLLCKNCNWLYDYERGIRDDGENSDEANETPNPEFSTIQSRIARLKQTLLKPPAEMLQKQKEEA